MRDKATKWLKKEGLDAEVVEVNTGREGYRNGHQDTQNISNEFKDTKTNHGKKLSL